MAEFQCDDVEKLRHQDKYVKEFEKLATIGFGSFGFVYKVVEKSNQSIHAIKRINYKKLKDKYFCDGIKELKILSQINSEHVVQFYDAWVEKDYIYIKMECCEHNLDTILTDKANVFNSNNSYEFGLIEYFLSIEMFIEIMQSLNFLHTLDPPIIHRDLKPENILISVDSQRMKLCDFGYAITHQYKGQSHTQDKGTIAYMAPEVVQSSLYEIQSDIYSLGLIGHKMFDFLNNSTKNTKPMDEKWKQKKSELKVNLQPILEAMALTPKWSARPYCEQLLPRINCLRLYEEEIGIIKNNYEIIESFNSFGLKFFENFFKTKIKDRLDEIENQMDMDEIDGQAVSRSFSVNNNNNEFVDENELVIKECDIIQIIDEDNPGPTIWGLYVGDGYLIYVEKESETSDTYRIFKDELKIVVQNKKCRINNLVIASQRKGLNVNVKGCTLANALLDRFATKVLIDPNHNLRIHFVSKCRYGRGFCERDNEFVNSIETKSIID